MSQRHTDVTGAASDANVAAVSGAAAFEADVFAGGTMKGVGAHAGCAMSGVTGATIGVAGGMMGRAEKAVDSRGAGDGGPRDALSKYLV